MKEQVFDRWFFVIACFVIIAAVLLLTLKPEEKVPTVKYGSLEVTGNLDYFHDPVFELRIDRLPDYVTMEIQ